MSDSASPESEPITPSSSNRLVYAATTLLAAIALGLAWLYLVALLALYELVPSWLSDALNAAGPIMVFAGAGLLIWKRPSLRWSRAVLLVCGGFFLYLVWDDAAPPPEIVLGPANPEEDRNAVAYRWMARSGPFSRVADDPSGRKMIVLPNWPVHPEERAGAVADRRRLWDAAYAEDVVGREWYAALAAHEPTALNPYASLTPPLQLQRVRRATLCHWAHALSLQQLGDPDEAARLLVLMARANYNLQRTGTSLAVQAVAAMNLKGTYEQLGLLLDAPGLSPDARELIAIVLERAPPVRSTIALAFLGSEIDTIASAGDISHELSATVELAAPRGLSRAVLRFLSPLLVNPNRTAREQIALLREASQIGQARQWDDVQRMHIFHERLERRPLKNPVGQLLAKNSFPLFDATVRFLWKSDEARIALIARATPAPQPGLLTFSAPPRDPLALEVINPRKPYDNKGAFVTTIYLIRNVSDQIVTFSGGPKYSWFTASGESGAFGPKFTTGPSSQGIMYGFGSVSGCELQPGQAFAFVSETQFGPDPHYVIKVRFDRWDGGMMFDRAGRAAGLKYYVQFNLNYQTRPVSPYFPSTASGNERNSVQLTAPSVPILP